MTWVVALLVAAPTIASNSSCPSGPAIEASLAPLLAGQSLRPGKVVVTTLPDTLALDLQPRGAGRGDHRSVAVDSDCDERARAAAVLIATWWPSQEVEPAQLADAAPAPPARQSRVGLSAGVFASAVSDGIAPGARAELSMTAAKLGLRLAASATASHRASVGPGKVEWRRLGGELGPTFQFGHERLDVGLVESVLFVAGQSLAVDRGFTAASMGVTAGLRVSFNLGRLLPWFELRGMGWAGTQQVNVVGESGTIAASHALPAWELQLGAGAALSL